MWIVKEAFSDVKDNGYVYKVGDTYPREGYEASEDRLRELSSHTNRLGAVLIEKGHTEPIKKPKMKGKKKAE